VLIFQEWFRSNDGLIPPSANPFASPQGRAEPEAIHAMPAVQAFQREPSRSMGWRSVHHLNIDHSRFSQVF
jgi:hypothetical protein